MLLRRSDPLKYEADTENYRRKYFARPVAMGLAAPSLLEKPKITLTAGAMLSLLLMLDRAHVNASVARGTLQSGFAMIVLRSCRFLPKLSFLLSRRLLMTVPGLAGSRGLKASGTVLNNARFYH